MKKLITLEVIGLSTMSTWDEQGPNPTWHVFGSYESIRVGFQVLSSDYCYFWVLGTYKVLLDLKFFFFKIRFSKLCHKENLQKPWENKEAQNNMKKKRQVQHETQETTRLWTRIFELGQVSAY